jgi:hypothetical protein
MYSKVEVAGAITPFLVIADADNSATFDGLDQDSLYLWGAQMEVGNYPTSYISNAGATTVTRGYDQLRYKGDDGNIVDNGQGTLACDVYYPDRIWTDNAILIIMTDGGVLTDSVYLYNAYNSYAKIVTAASGLSAGLVTSTTDIVDGTVREVRATWATNNLRLYVNGTAEGATDTDCGIPNELDRIDVGQGHTANQQTNGLLSNIKIYPRKKEE